VVVISRASSRNKTPDEATHFAVRRLLCGTREAYESRLSAIVTRLPSDRWPAQTLSDRFAISGLSRPSATLRHRSNEPRTLVQRWHGHLSNHRRSPLIDAQSRGSSQCCRINCDLVRVGLTVIAWSTCTSSPDKGRHRHAAARRIRLPPVTHLALIDVEVRPDLGSATRLLFLDAWPESTKPVKEAAIGSPVASRHLAQGRRRQVPLQ
jgi:hypothetical protein